jgi:hypothetical protein
MTDNQFSAIITPDHAPKVLKWFEETGGLQVWDSINLSNPGARWFTPNHQPPQKPNWQTSTEHVLVITDQAQVGVAVYKEVKRFRVALRVSGTGLYLKLTDAASRKLQKEMSRVGDEAVYKFDHTTQEAVILVPESTISLAEWVAQRV